MSVDLDETKRPLLTAVNGVFTGLCCAALCSRLLARWVSRAGWGWDDAMAVVAWAFVMASNACAFYAIQQGLGTHAAKLGSRLTSALRALYFDQVFVHPCLAFCKLTATLFYGRIFSAVQFERALWIVATMTVTWLFLTFPMVAAQCTPIRKAWEGSQYPGGHCINLRAFFIGQAVPNTLIDIILLCLPLVFVWRLQMTKTNKVALSGVFCIGAFEIGVSLVRLVFFIQLTSTTSDPTWDEWQSELWSRTETNVGFLCVCFMASGPLVKHVVGNVKSWTGRTSKERESEYRGRSNADSRSWAKPRILSRHREDFERLSSPDRKTQNSFEHLTAGTTAHGRSIDPDFEAGDIQLDEIRVTRDVHVSQTQKRKT